MSRERRRWLGRVVLAWAGGLIAATIITLGSIIERSADSSESE